MTLIPPRVVLRGIIQRPILRSQLQATISAVDPLFWDFGPFGPNRQWPPLIPKLVGFDTPADVLQQGMRWLYGEKSDEGATDPKTGAPSSKGLIPLAYLGEESTSRQVVTPTVTTATGQYPADPSLSPFGADWVTQSADLSGVDVWPNSLGDQQHPVYVWLVGVLNGKGVLLTSAYGAQVADTSGWLGNMPYDATRSWGVWIEWKLPPAVNGQNFESFRLYVADAPDFDPLGGIGSATKARYVDQDATVYTNVHPWANYSVTILRWTDGTDALATTTSGGNTVTVSESWGVFAAFWHAPFRILGVYGSDQGGGNTTMKPDRVKLDPDSRSDLLVPGFSAWPYPTTYREYLGEDGKTYWVTVILARGPLRDNHVNGVINLAVNAIGVEDVGDGTGLPLIDAHPCQQHWLENPILNEWTSGLWCQDGSPSTTPVWNDGTPKVKSSTFTARQAFTASALGGRGLTIGWVPETPQALNAHVADWNRSTETRLGENGHGQIVVFGFDETLDPTSWDTLTHRTDLFGSVTRTQGEERQTLVVASADYDPDAQKYRLGPATLTSPSGKRRYKHHDKAGDPIESPILNDPTQLSWIMQRRLQRLQYGTTLIEVTGRIDWLDRDVGDGVLLTSIEGTGASGYVDRPCIILRRKFSIQNRLVTYTLWDVNDLLIVSRFPNGLSQLFILGDEAGSPATGRPLGDETAVPSTALVLQ
jgi:hypothetical protein